MQTGTGQFTVDVNWTAHTADLVHVNGGTAQLAGTVVVNPMNLPTAGGLNQQFQFCIPTPPATSPVTPSRRSARPPSLKLLFPSDQDMVLSATINFLGVGVGGLNPNQTAIAENLNGIQLAGGSPAMSPLLLALMPCRHNRASPTRSISCPRNLQL